MVLIVAKVRTDDIKVGFSTSKKIGNSVVRNRAKRRLREAFSPMLRHIKPGIRLIFVARPAIAEQSFLEIFGEVKYLLKKAGVATENPEQKDSAANRNAVQPSESDKVKNTLSE